MSDLAEIQDAVEVVVSWLGANGHERLAIEVAAATNPDPLSEGELELLARARRQWYGRDKDTP